MLNRSLCLAIVVLLALAPAASGQQRPGTPPDAPQRPQAPGQHETASAADDQASQTPHVLRLDGREIRYTATAGRFPSASTTGRSRPGCSSSPTRRTARMRGRGRLLPVQRRAGIGDGVAAHGVVRTAAREDGRRRLPAGPPYQLVDNENSLIDVADLVFVDAIDTGYSA